MDIAVPSLHLPGLWAVSCAVRTRGRAVLTSSRLSRKRDSTRRMISATTRSAARSSPGSSAGVSMRFSPRRRWWPVLSGSTSMSREAVRRWVVWPLDPWTNLATEARASGVVEDDTMLVSSSRRRKDVLPDPSRRTLLSWAQTESGVGYSPPRQPATSSVNSDGPLSGGAQCIQSETVIGRRKDRVPGASCPDPTTWAEWVLGTVYAREYPPLSSSSWRARWSEIIPEASSSGWTTSASQSQERGHPQHPGERGDFANSDQS